MREREEVEAALPCFDLLLNLVFFVRLSLGCVTVLGVVEASAPAYGSHEDISHGLQLTVVVTRAGFFIGSKGRSFPGVDGATPTVPLKAEAEHDLRRLSALLAEVKNLFPRESEATVAADADVPFELLVATMDAVRETPEHRALFPDVTLAQIWTAD